MFLRTLFISALWSVRVNALVLHQRQVQRGAVALTGKAEPSCSRLTDVGSHFTVEISVGTPPQSFALIPDTGSLDGVIVKSCLCEKNSIECMTSGDCFLGGNRSSTFTPPREGGHLQQFTFGSGTITVAVATDVVRVGQTEVNMTDGLFLMMDRKLSINGNFEGILALGKTPSEQVRDKYVLGPIFLEKAGVDSFSMCMNEEEKGVLRLQAPKASKMLKSRSGAHWNLHLRGFGVGFQQDSNTSMLPKVCNEGADSCVGIPDSGSTMLMGPQAQVLLLFDELCLRWPRCKKAFDDKPSSEAGRLADAFAVELGQCNKWFDEDLGIDQEMPSIFVHVGGENGENDILELPPQSWVITQRSIFGAVCKPLIGEFSMTLPSGPVWILGKSFFHQYQVVYDMQTTSVGFNRAPCGSCDPTHHAVTSLLSVKGRHRAKRPLKTLNVPPRMPSIDPTQPL
jgi:hypothetical protein